MSEMSAGMGGGLNDTAARWSLRSSDRDYVITKRSTIGRADGTEIQLTGTGVSRQHATVEPAPEGIAVVDLQSKNGTYINDKRIERGVARAGDKIRVGNVTISVIALSPSENETVIMQPGATSKVNLAAPPAEKEPAERTASPANEKRPEAPVAAEKKAALAEPPRAEVEKSDLAATQIRSPAEKAPVQAQDAPKTEPPKVEAQKAEAPKTEPPPAESPKAAEKTAEKPADKPAEKPAEKAAEKAADKPAEKPVAADGGAKKNPPRNWWENTQENAAIDGTIVGGPPVNFAEYDDQMIARIEVSQTSLVGLSPNLRSRRVELDRDKYMMGRASDCDIVVDDPRASAQHAQFVLENGSWFVSNVFSTNSVFVNGQKAQRSLINNGDRIRIGDSEWVFKVPSGKKAASASKPAGERKVVKIDLANAMYFVGGILLTAGLFFLILYLMRK